MKKTDVEPIKTYLEDFFKEIYLNFKHKDPKILLKIQASLKEHVQKGFVLIVEKKLIINLLKPNPKYTIIIIRVCAKNVLKKFY